LISRAGKNTNLLDETFTKLIRWLFLPSDEYVSGMLAHQIASSAIRRSLKKYFAREHFVLNSLLSFMNDNQKKTTWKNQKTTIPKGTVSQVALLMA
jgi:hypothetical protein